MIGSGITKILIFYHAMPCQLKRGWGGNLLNLKLPLIKKRNFKVKTVCGLIVHVEFTENQHENMFSPDQHRDHEIIKPCLG